MKVSSLLTLSLLVLLSVNSVFAGRYYDSKTGRWLGVDPKAAKYPGLSPYSYCANNPLKFIDPDGKEFKISGDRNAAYNNVLSLAGKNNMQYVSVNQNGNISLAKGFTITKGGGSELLSNLVSSTKSYEYTAANSGTVLTGSGKSVTISTGSLGIISAVKGGQQNNLGMATVQPTSGDGQLIMDPGKSYSTNDGKAVPVTNIFFHELKEMQIMVEGGKPRYSDSGESAHDQAGQAGVTRANADNIDANGADGGTKQNPIVPY